MQALLSPPCWVFIVKAERNTRCNFSSLFVSLICFFHVSQKGCAIVHNCLLRVAHLS